jgi:hypothetical protein
MKIKRKLLNTFFYTFIFLNSAYLFSQQDSIPKTKSIFWQKVQFGGGLGLAFGNGYSNFALSPTGYYHVNKTVSVGFGISGSYVAQESNPSNFNTLGFKSTIFGGNLIGLFHPIENIQLSAEIEQLFVNRNFDDTLFKDDSFWNTGLFIGAGYRSQNVTFGVRFNLLHANQNNVYGQPWLPFVRVMF